MDRKGSPVEEISLLKVAMEHLIKQGPSTLILCIIGYIFLRYWILPKASADVEKTKSDQLATVQQADALKSIAESLKHMCDDHAKHTSRLQVVISNVSGALEASLAKDDNAVRNHLRVLRTVMDLGDLGS